MAIAHRFIAKTLCITGSSAFSGNWEKPRGGAKGISVLLFARSRVDVCSFQLVDRANTEP